MKRMSLYFPLIGMVLTLLLSARVFIMQRTTNDITEALAGAYYAIGLLLIQFLLCGTGIVIVSYNKAHRLIPVYFVLLFISMGFCVISSIDPK